MDFGVKFKSLYKIIFFIFISIFPKIFFAMTEAEMSEVVASEIVVTEDKSASGLPNLSYFKFIENYNSAKPLDGLEFKKTVVIYLEVVKKYLTDSLNFIDNKSFDEKYFNMHKISGRRDLAFGQKIMVKPGFKSILKSDIHGACWHLFDFINSKVKSGHLEKENPFKIVSKNDFFIFLGDNVDRGGESILVLYLLMRFKIENPENVFLLRGNHESFLMNNFFDEWYKEKNPEKRDLFLDYFEELYGDKQLIQVLYDTFPSFLLLGVMDQGCINENKVPHVNYFLFTHGGLEPRFDPERLLADERSCVFQIIDKIDLDFVKGKIKEEIFTWLDCFYKEKRAIYGFVEASDLGFSSLDFSQNEANLETCNIRGIKIGKELFGVLLKLYSGKGPGFTFSVVFVFRGHQHSELKFKLLDNFGVLNNWKEDIFNKESIFGKESILGKEKSLDLSQEGVLNKNDEERTFYKRVKLQKEFPLWTIGASPETESYGTPRMVAKLLNKLYKKTGTTEHFFKGSCAVINVDSQEICDWSVDKEIV